MHGMTLGSAGMDEDVKRTEAVFECGSVNMALGLLANAQAKHDLIETGEK